MHDHARILVFASLLILTLGTAQTASALTACTAAQIIAQDSGCPSGTGPCSITKTFTVPSGCMLDFGSRAVTLTANGTLDIDSGIVQLLAGSLTIAPGGF